VPISKRILKKLSKHKKLNIEATAYGTFHIRSEEWLPRVMPLLDALKEAGYKLTYIKSYKVGYVYCGNARITIHNNTGMSRGIYRATHDGKRWQNDNNSWGTPKLGGKGQYAPETPIRSLQLDKVASLMAKWLDKHAKNPAPTAKKPTDAKMPQPCRFKAGGIQRLNKNEYGLPNEIRSCKADGLYAIKEFKVKSGAIRYRATKHDGDPEVPVYIWLSCQPINAYGAWFILMFNVEDETFYPLNLVGGHRNITDRRKTDYSDTDRLCEDDLAIIREAVSEFLTNKKGK
jgi:hypothetical protein